jgi:hypothetical protein
LESSFDEFGDYKHRVIVQHLAYFQLQDGDLIDDVVDQCVLDVQTSKVLHEPVFYDAQETEHETELLAIPEGTPLNPPLLDQLLFQSVILITTSCAVGLVQISSQGHLSAPRNMLAIQMSRPSMMVLLLLLSLLELTPKSLMSKALRQINSLLTHWKAKSSSAVPL